MFARIFCNESDTSWFGLRYSIGAPGTTEANSVAMAVTSCILLGKLEEDILEAREAQNEDVPHEKNGTSREKSANP